MRKPDMRTWSFARKVAGQPTERKTFSASLRCGPNLSSGPNERGVRAGGGVAPRTTPLMSGRAAEAGRGAEGSSDVAVGDAAASALPSALASLACDMAVLGGKVLALVSVTHGPKL